MLLAGCGCDGADLQSLNIRRCRVCTPERGGYKESNERIAGLSHRAKHAPSAPNGQVSSRLVLTTRCGNGEEVGMRNYARND